MQVKFRHAPRHWERRHLAADFRSLHFASKDAGAPGIPIRKLSTLGRIQQIHKRSEPVQAVHNDEAGNVVHA
jgi:hypothetical protein